MEGIPNHDTENIAPFKVVGDDSIEHFSHENHPLKFYKNDIIYDKWLQCQACIHPLGFESIYGCEECGFFLHEKCANLPRKKRLIFDPVPLSLEVANRVVKDCMHCRVLFDGFKYTLNHILFYDVHCGSLSEPFIHDAHLHPLYFHKRRGFSCVACEDFAHGDYMLRCDACDFSLCFYCASLPLKIWHRSDDHHITLYCGEKVSIKSWCDICERELDQCKWFYTCSDCEVTFHTQCVVGDFSRLKPGKIIIYHELRFNVVRNNNSTRLICIQCDSRCKDSIILESRDLENGYICSRSCLSSYLRW